jgi:hypothetical protein
MSEITRSQYYDEIKSIASSMAEEALSDNDWDRDAAEEDINDSRLHETIDGHQWVIYTAYNLDVIRHSDNSDAYVDNFGTADAGGIIKDKGIDGLHAVMAYCAMEQDVRDILSDALDAAIESHESEIAEKKRVQKLIKSHAARILGDK